MKFRLLLFTFICFCFSTCYDPCDDLKNLECPTGDVDMDGIVNSDDIEPENPCIPLDFLECPTGDIDNDGLINSEDPFPLEKCRPKIPEIEFNLIGQWKYFYPKKGIVEFKNDGSYIDIEGNIFPLFGEIKTWFIKNNTDLVLCRDSENGNKTEYALKVIENNCDELIVDFGWGDPSNINFKRI
ncbi:MAG: hypothetical protein P1U56_03370 [Saprospiraceae bacterium]|nr:hypothetical protein [Saprospiraceae bacterium]